MKPPSGPTSARADINSSPPDRKRKRSNRRPSNEEASAQQTLQSLFSSQQKCPTAYLPTTPTSKRSRSDLNRASSTPTRSLALGDMYTFPSRSAVATSNGIIDVSSSPPATSPQARKTNGPIRARGGLNSRTGAKKLVVKNLKPNTAWDSKAYLEEIWAQLDETLAVIFKSQQDSFSREDLYRGVVNVCRQGGASILSSRLESRCKAHVELGMRDVLLDKVESDDMSLLKAVLAEWTRWTRQMATIRGIFFFMDRSYLLPSSKPTLDELTPLLFRETVFNHPSLKGKIIGGACDTVASERLQAKALDGDLFSQAVQMFHDISVYTSSFEPRFLAVTQDYINHHSNEMIVDKSLSDYVALADEIIAGEMARCDNFSLDVSTKRDLLALLEDHLVQRKETDLTDYDPVKDMLDDFDGTQKLTALYALLERRRLGAKLRPSFEKWIDETGTSIVFDDQSDDMIVRLLSFKRRLDMIWSTAFQRDESIGHGLRESFEVFINKTKKGQSTWGTDNTKVGEMIAKYVDQLLRGGAKAIPDNLSARRTSTTKAPLVAQQAVEAAADGEKDEDDDIDEDEQVNIQLDQVLDLFRFLHGKAVFEAFYKKDLARRLLMGRSASADAERSMLTRLKTECGDNFTQNLEQMFKDVELAREEMLSYKSRLEDRIGYEKGKNVELSVNILSAAAWPTYPDIPVIIPQSIQKAIADFELHYKSKHSGRKLDWKHALAHCQMRARFNKGQKELIVSSFQAIVLLLFNGLTENDHLTYQHILSETGLPEPEVKRTLQSLACALLRPLTKHPKGKEINDTDTFTIDLNFDHKKYRVKINQVQLKETKEENRATHERVQEDRNFETQAAIVRILKSRKTISHSELISEVIKATLSRGKLEVADIKKNIDRLIEKDYMEREDGNMYSYIA